MLLVSFQFSDNTEVIFDTQGQSFYLNYYLCIIRMYIISMKS